MRARRWLGAAIALALLAGCGDGTDRAPEPPRLVTVAPLEQGALRQPLTFTGIARPVVRARLAFQSSGILAERLVRLGDRVEAGQLVARLRNPELAPALQAAEAAIARLEADRVQAQRNLRRFQDLYQDGAIGEQQLEEQQTLLDNLENQLGEARANRTSSRERVEDALLDAPYAGHVTRVLREPGEFVQAGETVVELAGDGPLEVELQLSWAVWSGLEIGAPVALSLFPADRGQPVVTMTGEVRDIGRRADERTGLYPVVVRYQPAAGASPGQRVNATFERRIDDVLLVDLNAVVDPTGGRPRLYAVRDAVIGASDSHGSVDPVAVEVLGLDAGRVGFRAQGLEAGDLVITAGNLSLVPGQRVRLQRDSGVADPP
jgi:RND family efflux transporter MFP subunit